MMIKWIVTIGLCIAASSACAVADLDEGQPYDALYDAGAPGELSSQRTGALGRSNGILLGHTHVNVSKDALVSELASGVSEGLTLMYVDREGSTVSVHNPTVGDFAAIGEGDEDGPEIRFESIPTTELLKHLHCNGHQDLRCIIGLTANCLEHGQGICCKDGPYGELCRCGTC